MALDESLKAIELYRPLIKSWVSLESDSQPLGSFKGSLVEQNSWCLWVQ